MKWREFKVQVVDYDDSKLDHGRPTETAVFTGSREFPQNLGWDHAVIDALVSDAEHEAVLNDGRGDLYDYDSREEADEAMIENGVDTELDEKYGLPS